MGPAMMRIVVVCLFGALLAACSGSSRLESILRANSPSHPTMQYTAAKGRIENPSAAREEATRFVSESEPQEAQKSIVQSFSEE